MNEIVYKSIMVSRYCMKKKVWNKRFASTGIAFLFFLYLVEEGILNFCRNTHLKVTPWIFPFLSGDWICQMMMCGYFVWLVSALTEEDESDLFILARSKKYAWVLGNCLAIIEFAALFTLTMMILSVLPLLPEIEFSFAWGKAWNTLANTNAATLFNIGTAVSAMTIHLYKPVEATIYAMILLFLCLAWLGMLMYMVNSVFQKPVGIYLALAVVFLDVMLFNTGLEEKLLKFSPVTLTQLSNYSVATLKYGISIPYALTFYIAGILIFILVNMIIVSKRAKA